MKKLGLFLGFITLALTSVAQSTEQTALTLTLEQALEIALSESPTIKVAEQEIEIKRYAKQETYASLYPRLDATAQYQRVLAKQTMSMDFGGQTQTIKVGSDNSFNGGVSASMPVVNAQLWESLKISVADVMLAIEKARSSQIDMIEQVSQAYFSVLLAKESLVVYQRVYDNAVENNKNIKKRYDVGSVSEYDFISSNVSVQNAIPNVIEAQNSVVLTLWQLKALLGIDLKKNIDVAGSLADYEAQMNYAHTLDQLDLSKNSTLKQLDIQEGMLESALKITKLANVPTLSINAAYLYTALGNDGKFFQAKAWNPYSYAGVQLNIPIFAGNQRRAATRQAKLNLSNLQLQRENAERQLQVAVVNSLNNMQTNVKKFSAAAATVGQAQRGYEIAVKRYEVGRGTLVDVDNSQLQLTQAELGRNSAIYNFLMAKISLDKILGNHNVKSKHDYIDRYESMYEKRYGNK
ncbi:MAG: TolC family protein [Rikenellaceae bacterium]|nr:TolC family protein [Rikenellaceae bacterium]